MATKAVRNRNKKRFARVNKDRAKRDLLRVIASDINRSEQERWDAGKAMQRLSRDSSPSRRRNRCKLCGRPRAYNRLTGLCRLHMRIATISGMVPGMHKASW